MRSARVVSSVIRMTLGYCDTLRRGKAFGRWAGALVIASKRNGRKDKTRRRTAIEMKKGVYHTETALKAQESTRRAKQAADGTGLQACIHMLCCDGLRPLKYLSG